MLCFSLKKKSTIFFRTVFSWTPEYYVLRETTEVRFYQTHQGMSSKTPAKIIQKSKSKLKQLKAKRSKPSSSS